ncbi:23S rRNA pseudouridine(2604) synthase RluF [Dysgonomonas sp. HGC4]|uniref:23S rRNA pseudouridine(2604) synthase RluF n=1 Tax=Dysgonomonas sp. HGC4 TaxID=1658009 RepID=UPI000681DF8C|nr:23S rRNA pseudouridine(2604) synthase RluF [Dysgonomonas sp. HGC4]MBD8346766.1 23S rRNA pseudouridine(2604) synthase RluF [Dysgonomonas sp. HGC4]
MEYRLNKYISASGYCSRREADKYIESGNVTVNGKKATIGSRVLPGQKVKVNGELIENKVEPVYIAFNKPVGVVSSTNPLERDNIIEFIRHEQRIFPIGRLDKDSQGLILLTNDGDIVNKILRAGNNHKKDYIVTVNRPITSDFITRMSQGVPILDRVTRRCEIEKINPYTFKISLIQGLNRQIRRMCEYFNYDVLKLERIQIMNIKLDKLGQGNWRNLTASEMEGLFDMLEASEKTPAGKTPSNSNKSFNRALEEHDIRTNYRKGSLAAKKASANKTDKDQSKKFTPTSENGEDKPKPRSKGKPSSGLRVGKQKMAANKPKTKAKSKSEPKGKDREARKGTKK